MLVSIVSLSRRRALILLGTALLLPGLLAGCGSTQHRPAADPIRTGSPTPAASTTSTPSSIPAIDPPAVPAGFPLGAGLSKGEQRRHGRVRANDGNLGIVVDPCGWTGPQHVGPIGGVDREYGVARGLVPVQRGLLTFTSERRAASYLRQVAHENRDCRRTRSESGTWWDRAEHRATGPVERPALLVTWHDHGGRGLPQTVGAVALVQRGRAVLVCEVSLVRGRSLADALRLGRRTLRRTAPVVRAMHVFE